MTKKDYSLNLIVENLAEDEANNFFNDIVEIVEMYGAICGGSFGLFNDENEDESNVQRGLESE